MLNKTKKFIKKNKFVIAFIAGGVVVCGATVAGIHRWNERSFEKLLMENENLQVIHNVLGSIPKGAKVQTFGGSETEGFTPNELGRLGEKMVELGLDGATDKFTHFIAIRFK